ncbi:acetyl-CoA acetyltransferase [Janibacter melonis]|uniref:Probable acetyl-CoA acetyltransferase n=1 Tax=Janibacter melonis TaxID=262209 RepID=A0A176QH56_9MICO|nr:acetyl-CoA C-acetyltransferase [Janibacter melonis]OAB88968.1 acetyl-CoA acetyltransferase [Janibacter melonis]
MRDPQDVVVCAPYRTAVGGFGGSMRPLLPAQIGTQLMTGLIERTGIDPAVVEDVILGHCYANGEAPAIGRVVALDAGLPVTTTGMQLDRRCGSGLQAIIQGVMQVLTGANDCVVAGGVESMSNAPFYSLDMRWGAKGTGVRVHDMMSRGRETAGGVNHPVPGGMIETAENLRREYSISREEQDALAVQSHQRAAAAQREGLLAQEIVPVRVPQRRGEDLVVEVDEHIRPETSMESLARLRPILGAGDPEATVTAGNASGQNDAAAFVVIADRATAAAQGLAPLMSLRSWAVAGTPPKTMGIGPVPATARALDIAGLTLADIDVIELNEAFAAQALAVMREWGFTQADHERTNVHGSGISLGHPVGATGGRMTGALARELHRRDGRYGLATMCIGGGQGLAAIFERADA